MLLTQRTQHLSAHAGQISFPGGRIEESDADATEAALRETEEEVGLLREHVTVIGRLDTYVTGTGFEITPIVGIVKAPFPLAIDPTGKIVVQTGPSIAISRAVADAKDAVPPPA